MSYDKLVKEKEQLESKLVEINEKIKLTTEYQQLRKIEMKKMLDNIKKELNYCYIFSNYFPDNWDKLTNIDIIKDCKYECQKGFGDRFSSDNNVIIEYIDGHKLTIIYYLDDSHEHEEFNMTLICPTLGEIECPDLDQCGEDEKLISDKLNKCMIGRLINYYSNYIKK